MLKRKWNQHKMKVLVVLTAAAGIAVAVVAYKEGMKTNVFDQAERIRSLEKSNKYLYEQYQNAVWESIDNLDAVNSVLDYFNAGEKDLVALREITGHDIIAQD